MKKCDMPYAMSVFLPECGMNQEVLSKMELVDVLGLQHEDYIKTMGDTTPLLIDIVESIKAKGGLNPNQVSKDCQTEDMGSEHLSLD